MDAERFDRMVKSLAARASRRGLVGGLAALVAIGGGDAWGPSRAGAQDAPGLPDGTGPTTEDSDPSCQGEPAINNRTCPQNQCTANRNCFCAEAVTGKKKCVNGRDARCPGRDQCDGHRDCQDGEACVRVGGCCGNRRRHLCVPLCR